MSAFLYKNLKIKTSMKIFFKSVLLFTVAIITSLSTMTSCRTMKEEVSLADFEDRHNYNSTTYVGKDGEAYYVLSYNLKGKWNLTKLNAREVSDYFDAIPSITFDTPNKQISGFAGCNTYTGGYNLSKDSYEFSAPSLATTSKFCLNNHEEPQFLEILRNPSIISIEYGVLKFTQNGRVVLEFEKDYTNTQKKK